MQRSDRSVTCLPRCYCRFCSADSRRAMLLISMQTRTGSNCSQHGCRNAEIEVLVVLQGRPGRLGARGLWLAAGGPKEACKRCNRACMKNAYGATPINDHQWLTSLCYLVVVRRSRALLDSSQALPRSQLVPTKREGTKERYIYRRWWGMVGSRRLWASWFLCAAHSPL